MALKIRRGLEEDREDITPAEGELIYTTDEKKLYVGDGSTAGGILVTASTEFMNNPMTTAGDLIYGGVSGVPTRLAKGSQNYVLTMGATNPQWAAAGGSSGSPALNVYLNKNFK